MKGFAKYFLSCFFFLCSCFCYSQQTKIDSLAGLLKTSIEDTNKVNTLNGIAREMQLSGDYEIGMNYADKARQLAKKINFKKGIAAAYGNFGNIYHDQGNYKMALENQLAALKIDEELSNKNGIAKRLGNIGGIYKSLGDYPKALDYCLKAIKMDLELGNKKRISIWYSNIGNIYYAQATYPKALEYHFKALKIAEELKDESITAAYLSNIGLVYYWEADHGKALSYYYKALKILKELRNKSGVASVMGNIGNLYFRKNNYPMALDCFFQSLRIAEELGDKESQAIDLGNIGNVYSEEADKITGDNYLGRKNLLKQKALEYYVKALKMAEELEDMESIARHLGNIGAIYSDIKKYKSAYVCLYRSIAIADSIGTKENVEVWYDMLSKLYQTSDIMLPDSIGGKILNPEQMRLRALYYHKRSIAINDAIFSEESKKQLVRKEMNFEFEKKEAEAKAEQDKKDAVATADANRQKIVLLLVSFVLLLMAVVAFIIFRSLRTTHKQKLLIEKQKHLVEEKQKEILDSIHYAKRIQTVLMPNEKYIARILSRLRAKPHD